MAKSKVKGGGTKKVCLPAAKARSLSKKKKGQIIRAKETAGRQGKYKRSSKTNVKGARKKGATLRDWFEKENWIDIKTGKECGAAMYGPSKSEPRRTTKGKGRNFRTVKEGAGMTAKGVKEYRRKNPGSKLKTAVTGKVKPGSKAAKRRKSFCARSKHWKGERGIAARKRWKC